MAQTSGPISGQWEPFDRAVFAANAWITQHSVRVLNVETLLMPNVWNSAARGTLESRMHSSAEMATHWYQIVRVWFDPEPAVSAS